MEKVDINTIPYDAPLSIEEPPMSWTLGQNRKGSDRTFLTVPDADLRGKWVIITGSNNGIGREAALQMAAWGANIILGCRNPPPHEVHPEKVVEECQEKAKTAGHEETVIEWWEMDCTNLNGLEEFTKRWLDTGRTLDLLCNNAGMGSSPGGNSVFKTRDGFEIIHQVNFLSHVLITLRLLPSLAAAPEPRVICTTSCFHFLGKFDVGNFNGENQATFGEGIQFYQNNKLWFQVWLTELQRRLLQHDEYKHITVHGVHPGYVNSGIWQLTMQNDWLLPLKTAIVKAAAWFFGINEQQGSLAILNAATSREAGPDPKIQGVGHPLGGGGGKYWSRTTEETAMPHTRDPDCRQRVWRKVNDELKLEEKGLLDVLGLKYVE
jgi:NAD(P)-dependent dehydrogenase (short-subunit alcohol dehydrogenase family)